jgi:protein-S-isoprenylcysteine O-methyltransferase Ste14
VRVAVAALVIFASYVALASLRPLIITRVRVGSWAFRGGARRGRLVGAALSASWGVVCVGAIFDLSGQVDRIGALDWFSLHAVGVVIAVAGLPLIVVAQATMGASWRIGVDPGEKTELVTEGVFRFSRNPIYCGMVAMAVGVALMVPNAVSVAAVALFIVAVELQVRAIEEPYLRRVHGTEFTNWAATSGRFLPGIGTTR